MKAGRPARQRQEPADASPGREATDWFVYLLACADGSLYCGVTTDVLRRETEHRAGRGARYTRSRGVVGMVWACGVADKTEALQLEYRLKRQPASLKRLLASGA